MTRFFFF